MTAKPALSIRWLTPGTNAVTGYLTLLHAWRLGGTHPRTGEQMTWEAALPEDFQGVISCLKSTCS